MEFLPFILDRTDPKHLRMGQSSFSVQAFLLHVCFNKVNKERIENFSSGFILMRFGFYSKFNYGFFIYISLLLCFAKTLHLRLYEIK